MHISSPARAKRLNVIQVLAVVLVAAAVVSASGTARSTDGTTIVYRVNADWSSYDYQTLRGTAASAQMIMPVTDRLVAFGPGQKIVPYVASRWVVTPTSVTFFIRQDKKMTCADGTPLTPEVIGRSFARQVDGTKHSISTLAAQYGPGPYSVHWNMKKWTFTFTVGTPYSPLLLAFAHPQESIYCPKGYANEVDNKSNWYGSGPYTVVSAVHGDAVVYQKRPEWNWGPPGTDPKKMPDTLIIKIITDETTAANALITGAVDFSQISGTDQARLDTTQGLTRSEYERTVASMWVIPNMAAGKFGDNPAIRLALYTALDPKVVNQLANNGRGTVLGGPFLAPGADCYDPKMNKLLTYPNQGSVTAALNILTTHGFTFQNGKLSGSDGKQIGFTITTPTTTGSMPEYLAAQWSQLGFNVSINQVPTTTFASLFQSGNFDVSVGTVAIRANDPSGWISFMTGKPVPDGTNVGSSGYRDTFAQAQVVTAMGALGDTRCMAWDNVFKRYHGWAYAFPLNAVWDVYYSDSKVSFVPFANTQIEPAFIQVK